MPKVLMFQFLFVALQQNRVLQFFGAHPDDYDVVFTSGATAAIRIVFENFDFCGEDGEVQAFFFPSIVQS